MQTIFLLLCKGHISIYESDGFCRKYVNGNESIHFHRSQLKEDLQKMKADLCNEYNINSEDDFTFILLENEDRLLNEALKNGIRIKASIPISLLLDETIKVLSKKNDLKMELYGLNFDEKSYLVSGGGIASDSFSLFAHTVQDDELIVSSKNRILDFMASHQITL